MAAYLQVYNLIFNTILAILKNIWHLRILSYDVMCTHIFFKLLDLKDFCLLPKKRVHKSVPYSKLHMTSLYRDCISILLSYVQYSQYWSKLSKVCQWFAFLKWNSRWFQIWSKLPKSKDDLHFVFFSHKVWAENLISILIRCQTLIIFEKSVH